ncbi:NAD(P)/FAD-dependent oxidoreductase [Leptospira langatensis]|uniref:NAD(P)/FAD-dependent oxidoreductase n=1 Tax=Leptospira langatensis TaxID=2484983 RepID=A0A5F1ZS42_9LEPT|nr:NAD(P)/FAD-dependent oxidoreductase [Leptospira langatensis]TGJ98822.1 NAD(P)/FAD-dependent oxidoreductase [Leptospira langatensis]TGL40611.1 NAD(P)/FAD-dependent oxidoreductase [Leptospira langatensis]
MQSGSSTKRVVVIGGGAAGFFGAIQTRLLSESRVEVSLYEKSPNALSKVKISGGGRCNVTHSCFEPEELAKRYPRGEKELRRAFEIFQPKDTIRFFETRGVKLKTESDGRMFPVTDDSETILQCLLQEAKRLGVKIKTKVPITGIYTNEDPSRSRFRIQTEEGEEDFDAVLVASGSSRKVWGWLENMGHTIESPVPSLFTFEIQDDLLDGFQGLSVADAEVSLQNSKLKQRGPVLFTHWGLSGPAVLKLSAWGARELFRTEYKENLIIDWVPDLSRQDLRERLLQKKKENPARKPGTNAEFDLPSRFWERIWEKATGAEKRWSEVSSKELHIAEEILKRTVFRIQGKGVFKEEFVTCGGVKRKEVDFTKMESKIVPGLHFAGEVLDIDGITGGFNFQNAWTTSYIAALSIAKELSSSARDKN